MRAVTAPPVVLVPRRADGGHRDRLWSYVRDEWLREFPNWTIAEGHHHDGPFNRSAALNRAARDAGDWDVAVVADADTVTPPDQVHEAVATARHLGCAVLAYDQWCGLHERGTERVLAGDRRSWRRWTRHRYRNTVSSCLVVPRRLWDSVGGFDEGFVGWGFEDVAFWSALDVLGPRPVQRIAGPCWHLWHPTSPERDRSLPDYQRGERRRARYLDAREQGADAMRRLLDEIRADA